MKEKRIFLRSVSLLLTLMMLISSASMIATAETVAGDTRLVEQTINALLYTDESYSEMLSDGSAVTISGALPEGTAAKAYPVTVDAENVCAAYDITLFDKNGAEFEPESAVTVDISTPGIESAIRNGDTLTAYHITDENVTEEVAVKSQSGDTVTFEAKSFSVYYIADGTPGGDITYRRTYVFYSLKENANAGSTNKSDYEPYYFTIERGGRTMQTNQQILTEGESLLVPQLPYHGDDAFAGWYTGTESGSNINFGEKATFDTEITGIQSAGEDQTINLYARFGVEKYLTFFYEPEANINDDLVFYVYPVVVPAEGTVTVQLFDYLNQASGVNAGSEDLRHVKAPVPTTKNVFLGWTTDRAGAKASAGIDETAAETRQNRATEVSVSKTGCTMKVNGQDVAITDLSFYPIFDNANWVSFDGGKSGNGSTYEAPIYIVTTEIDRYLSLPTITRKGYNFDGWYYDENYDTTNYTLSNSAVKITDSDGSIVNVTDQTALGAMYITPVSGGYAICPKKEEVTLHAKWTEAATTYKIAFWAQSKTVHYGTEAWSSSALTNYDFLLAVDSSEFNQTAVTGSKIDISTVRSNFLTYLAGNSDFSEYADTTRFFYNDEKTKADVDEEIIKPDGSTVINIFYDRVWYEFSFFFDGNSGRTTSSIYGSGQSSNYTHYTFPGGYLQNSDGTYQYYANIYYAKGEGPFPNYSSGRITYYTLNGDKFESSSDSLTLYTSNYLETGANRTFIELNGADTTEKWPRTTPNDLTSDTLTYQNNFDGYVHSVVYVMPTENRNYKRYYVSNNGDMYAKFYLQTIPDNNHPTIEFASPIIDEHFFYGSPLLHYAGEDMRLKQGFTPIAVVGLDGNNSTTRKAFLKDGYSSNGIPGFPTKVTSDEHNEAIFAYQEGTNSSNKPVKYWDTYYLRNSYNFIIVDADNISNEYALERRMYEAPFEDELADYETLNLGGTSGVDNDDILKGTPVKGTQIGRAGDNKTYTFGGVYKDSSCQQLVYEYKGANAGKLVAGTALANEGMPDHPLTVFIKWNPVEFKVEIDPSEGALTSSTESTYFNVDEGELIKEYNRIERKYVEDPQGDYYYLYIPSTIVADHELGRMGATRSERYAKYVTIAEFNASEDYKKYYSRDENGSYTYEGDYTDAEENPRVYPGAGSVYRYSPDDGTTPTYHFVGWFKEQADGSLELYNFSTEVHEDTTLKALWRSGQKFRIQYDANEYEYVNGERTDTVIFTGKVENSETKYDTNVGTTNILNYGEGASAIVKYAAKADENNARAQFLYWVDKQGRQHDYNEVFTIAPDMVDTVIEGEEAIKVVRLTAHYSTIESIGLRYNANTGAGSAVSDIEYYSENHAVTLHSASRDGFENSGKTIVGWSTQSGDNSVEYKLGGKYGINDKDIDGGVITLYAVWKTAATVTYNLNGGSFSETPAGLTANGTTYTADSYVGGTAPEPSPDPTKSGYTFAYWTTDNPANVTTPTQYDFSTELTGDVTLYAYYTTAPEINTKTLNVRYFVLNENGELVYQDYNNAEFWYSTGSTSSYAPIKTITINSTNSSNYPIDIAKALKCSSTSVVDRLKEYSGTYKYTIAFGIGVDTSDGSNSYLIGSKSFTNCTTSSPLEGGSYLKIDSSGNVLWSVEKESGYQIYDNNPAVYVVFMKTAGSTTNYPITSYSYQNVIVTNSVSGTDQTNYDSSAGFTYRATVKDNSGTTTISTEEFTLKNGETHTISILTNNDSTKNQIVTVEQIAEPTGSSGSSYTFDSITSTAATSGKSVTLTSSATSATFNNIYTYTVPTIITPTNPADNNLTITGNVFTEIDENDRPAGVHLLNGDKENDTANTVTVNIAVVDSNGVIVDNLVVTGSDDSLKLYTDQLEDYKTGGYSLKVTLDVENTNDPTVSLADTYVETDSGYTVIPDSGSVTDKDGRTWTKEDNNNYTVPVSDLFDGEGKLKGADASGAAAIDLYSQIRTERIHVIYKYYDRDRSLSQSAAPDISAEETTVSNRYSAMGSTGTNIEKIGAAITKAMPSVNNELDTVIFNVEQNAYVTALTTEAGRSLRGTAYYTAYYTANSGTYHTDCYGRTANDPDYMKEYKAKGKTVTNEKWVTYRSTSSEDADITASGFDIYEITDVTVWGFNTPTSHTVRYVIPNASSFATDGAYTSIKYVTSTEAASKNTGTDIYFAKPENTAPEFGTYYFNQRLGEKVGNDDNDARNDTPHHLEMYGQSYIKSASELPSTGAANGTIALPMVEGYTFDGWYVDNGSGKYAKICSDERFGDRVTADVTLYAGYTKNSDYTEQNPKSDAAGITLTKNAVEHYVENGVERTRYVTMLNAYGYGSNGAGYDTGFDNKKMAMIYVFFDPSVDTSALNGIDIAGILSSDENFSNTVAAAIASTSDPVKTISITVNGITSAKSFLYTYQIVDSGSDTVDAGSNPITFTNKNRAQFTLDIKKTSADTGTYSKALVLAAVYHNDDDLKFSDNCLVYANGN